MRIRHAVHAGASATRLVVLVPRPVRDALIGRHTIASSGCLGTLRPVGSTQEHSATPAGQSGGMPASPSLGAPCKRMRSLFHMHA